MVSASGRVAMLITASVIAGCGASDESAPPPAPAAAQTEKTDDRRYMPVSDARAIVREHVYVPVTVPAALPAGVRARSPVVNGRAAQLTLKVPDERFRLIIWYGWTGFDGCGPIDPREVTVNGRSVVLDTDSYRSKLVWPATLQNLEGRFALYGRFLGKRILAFAESMTARGAPSGGPKSSC